MYKFISFLSFVLCLATLAQSQNQTATIKIEKIENGETTIIEKKVELKDGQDFNSILQELGVLDDLGNLNEGQSFEINVKKKDGLNTDQDITIEYFDAPNFTFETETKAFLGVMLSANGEGEGVLISSVIEGTKAEEANLQSGDVILAINESRAHSVGELVEMIGQYEAGDVIDLEYNRGGEIIVQQIELGETSSMSNGEDLKMIIEGFEIPNGGDMNFFEFDSGDNGDSNFWIEEYGNPEEQTFFGVSPDSQCGIEEDGVKIGKVIEGSSAEKMGIQVGDLIQEFNGKKVNDFSELSQAIGSLNPGDEVKVNLMREGKKEKIKGNIGSKADVEQDHSFIFSDPSEIHIELDGEFPEGLENMFFELENLNTEEFDSEEFERRIEELLTPMLEEMQVVTEEITINISVESITEEDLDSVNQNAEVELKTDDDLQFGFISFFPNPMNGEFNLKFQLEDSSPYRVLVYDQTGRTVFEDSRNMEGEYNNVINLNGLANGPYFLQIVQGENTYSRKIIKE